MKEHSLEGDIAVPGGRRGGGGRADEDGSLNTLDEPVKDTIVSDRSRGLNHHQVTSHIILCLLALK